MPALARLKQSARDQAMSLEEAILGINERRQQQAQGIYQYETSLAEQRRQFDQQMAEQRRQAAAAARAAGSGFAPSLGALGNMSGTQGAQSAQLSGGRTKEQAQNAVQNLLRTNKLGLIAKTAQAIYTSANRGNTYDQAKLELLRHAQPGLFNRDGSLNTKRIAGLGRI